MMLCVQVGPLMDLMAHYESVNDDHRKEADTAYYYCDMIYVNVGLVELYGGNAVTGYPFHSRYGNFDFRYDDGTYMRHKY